MEIKSKSNSRISEDFASAKKQKIGAAATGNANALEQVGSQNSNYNVKLSPESRKVSSFQKKLFDAAKNSPDVREDKVQEYQERIRNGSYEVDAGKIADGMLREAIREKLATNP